MRNPGRMLNLVIACAGASRRMGRPKGLLPWGDRSLLRAHVDAGHAAGLCVRVVLGAGLEAHRAVLPPGVTVVENPRWAETDMAESVALGAAGLRQVLVLPVDTPVVRVDTLRQLAAAGGCAVPTWEGRDGHPVRVALRPGEDWHPALRLDVRLRDARRIPVDDPAVTGNLNTPEAVRAWRGAR